MPKRKESPELKAMHKAFEKHIEETFTLIDCFTEYTLQRNEYGSYTNLSVSMEWPIFVRGWNASKKYFKSTGQMPVFGRGVKQ